MSELDLGARVLPVPRSARFSDPSWFIWCGAPLKGSDGRYHLYYSRWPVKSGFMAWATQSELAYAVSEKPLGPYRFVNVALPARRGGFWDGDCTHNPNILEKDGKLYLFYMGNHGDGTYETHRNHQRIGVAVAERPEGPWKRLDTPILDISADKTAFDSLCVTNPAATVRPDGGVLLLYKAVEFVEGKRMGGRVRYGAALASDPLGPYTKTPGRLFEAEGDDRKTWMLAEDPYLWYERGYWAIARDVVGRFTGAPGGIALFQSEDGLRWKAAAKPKVLESQFRWADGTPSFDKLERPALLLDRGVPVALFGATDGYLKGGRVSSNVQIPLRVPQRILCVGDSITEGGSSFSVYRPLLAEKLEQAGFLVTFVGSRGAPPLHHEGYGGRNAEFLAATVPAHVQSEPPDIVLIHAGHNHFVEEKPVPGILAATESLIASLRALNPKVVVLLAQVIPAGKLPKYSYLPELNQGLATLAARLRVTLVDQASGFDWATDTVADKVHPNARGAEKMAQVWFEALKRVWKELESNAQRG